MPRTVNVGLESIRPSQDASIAPSPSPPHPPPPVGWSERSRGGGWRTSGIPGGPAPSIQVPVSRKPAVWKPRASPAPAKRRRSLSAPSTSLYGPHSPQSKAATELTSQDGGYCRSSNVPQLCPVLVSLPATSTPATKSPDSPRRAQLPWQPRRGFLAGPRCGQTVGGPLSAATFKAHRLSIQRREVQSGGVHSEHRCPMNQLKELLIRASMKTAD